VYEHAGTSARLRRYARVISGSVGSRRIWRCRIGIESDPYGGISIDARERRGFGYEPLGPKGGPFHALPRAARWVLMGRPWPAGV
jgi:hypothetical protein